MKKTLNNKPLIIELGVRADRLTYFAQHQRILQNADRIYWPTFYRMSKPQIQLYDTFIEWIQTNKIEHYFATSKRIHHIWYGNDSFGDLSCGETLWSWKK